MTPVYSTNLPQPMYYEDWQKIREWLDENNIRWHAMGEKRIGFDREEERTLFLLKWK